MKNRFLKRIIWGCITILLILCLADFCQKKTKGFRVYKITKTTYDEADTPVALEESLNISSILNTPFYYYKKGKSSYVFLSQDKQYILKLFQSPQITPPEWTSWKISQFFIPTICEKWISQKQAQKKLQFTSYRTAFDHLKEQTGIIYLHLSTSSSFQKDIIIYDNIGIKHFISADKTAFILQRKGEAFCPYFESLLKENQKEKAKEWITRFALLIRERAQKNIQDKDLSPRYNLGILNDSFLTFDVDSLRSVDSSLSSLEHMRQDAKKMRVWLRSKQEGYDQFLEEELIRLHQE